MMAARRQKSNAGPVTLALILAFILLLILLPINAQDSATLTIELNRTFDCPDCTAAEIPGNTIITVSLTANTTGNLSDLVHRDFLIFNDTNGTIISYNESYVMIAFTGTNGAYTLRSPPVTAPVKYTFLTVLGDTPAGEAWFAASVFVVPPAESVAAEGIEEPGNQTNQTGDGPQGQSGPDTPLLNIELHDGPTGIYPNLTTLTHQENITIQWNFSTVGGSLTDTWTVGFGHNGSEITTDCGTKALYFPQQNNHMEFFGDCTTYCTYDGTNARIDITAAPTGLKDLRVNVTFFTCANGTSTGIGTAAVQTLVISGAADSLNDTLWVNIQGNSKPSVASATLSPAFPATTEDIICGNGSVTDADGQPVDLHYSWIRNGTSIEVLHLPFDNTSDQRFVDLSGFNQDVKIGNTTAEEGARDDVYPVLIGEGRIGFAINTTQGKHINVTDNANLNFSNSSFAIEFWVKRTGGAATNQVLLEKKVGTGTGTEGYGVVFNTGNNIALVLNDGAGADVNVAGNSTITDTTTFHHIVAQIDADKSVAEIWKDGTLIAYSVETESSLDADADLYIGTNFNDPTSAFNTPAFAVLDELIIYNVSLDDDFILAHNNSNYSYMVNASTANEQNWSCQITPFDNRGQNGSTSASANVTIGSCNVTFTEGVEFTNGITFGNAGHQVINVSAQRNDKYNITEKATTACATVNVSLRTTGNLVAGSNVLQPGNVTVNSTAVGSRTITLSTTYQLIRTGVRANTNNVTDFGFWLTMPDNQVTGAYEATIEVKVEKE